VRGNFEKEVVALPGAYAPPDGRLMLAIRESAGSEEEAIGCAALRRFEADACELKRLYVRPAVRGEGAGRQLVKTLIAEARSIGYRRMLLDTLPSMREAHKLYRTLGFREIPSYRKDAVLSRFSSSFRCTDHSSGTGFSLCGLVLATTNLTG